MSEQQYFTVHHSLTVNVEKLQNNEVLPEPLAFEKEIPTPFIVASEFSQLDVTSEQTLSELRANKLGSVISLIENQNSKLNLLLTFLLSQQDDPKTRAITDSFGASQCTFVTTQAFNTDDLVRVRLFVDYPAAAIYCYGQISDVTNKNEQTLVTVQFIRIRDVDQDILIRAALHQQQKLLRQRSMDRGIS
jgi:hypothetical protein